MRIYVIKEQSIVDYIIRNNQSRIPFQNWLQKVKDSDWDMPIDMISTFNSVDLLGKRSHRVVYNVGGNRYRMICHYNFGRKRVLIYIKWIGTHAEYAKLCKSGKQYTISYY